MSKDFDEAFELAKKLFPLLTGEPAPVVETDDEIKAALTSGKDVLVTTERLYGLHVAQYLEARYSPVPDDYIINLSCPFCKAGDIEIRQGLFWFDNCAERRMRCPECGRYWDEHYALMGLDLAPPPRDCFGEDYGPNGTKDDVPESETAGIEEAQRRQPEDESVDDGGGTHTAQGGMAAYTQRVLSIIDNYRSMPDALCVSVEIDYLTDNEFRVIEQVFNGLAPKAGIDNIRHLDNQYWVLQCWGRIRSDQVSPKAKVTGSGGGRVQFHHVTNGSTKGWVHTHGMDQFGLPELEMRAVPGFLVESAARILTSACDYMIDSAKKVSAGETMALSDHTVFQFVKADPIPGAEEHYEAERWQIVEVERLCECCQAKAANQAQDEHVNEGKDV